MSMTQLTNQSRIKVSIKQRIKSGSNKLTHYFQASSISLSIKHNFLAFRILGTEQPCKITWKFD